MRPSAIVMNMFYTGIGIARSLGERGIRVIGLTAQHGIYGNFTRYARIVACPDSRNEPAALLAFLLRMGKETESGSVIFPTRDDDVLFLDRFRQELSRYFILTVPESSTLNACLDKWETYQWSRRAGVAAPKSWLIDSEPDLHRVFEELTYPCVLKPVASHHWRKGDNWEIVGGRKAIGISSQDELLAEYTAVARANCRALLQEMVPGGDDCLAVAACYLDRESNWVAGFTAKKLVQAPEYFGTGCIVQAVNRPELFEPTKRLLQTMRFTGIAEVEYKWDAAIQDYKLIEINPRPWDQHRLGAACGVDLVHLAYCEHAGLAIPVVGIQSSTPKWIAEDTFLMAVFQSLWRRDGKVLSLFRLARGKRTYAIWSARDPVPSMAYLLARFLPALVGAAVRAIWSAWKRTMMSKTSTEEKGLLKDTLVEKGKSRV